jgi:hypothetical protein
MKNLFLLLFLVFQVFFINAQWRCNLHGDTFPDDGKYLVKSSDVVFEGYPSRVDYYYESEENKIYFVALMNVSRVFKGKHLLKEGTVKIIGEDCFRTKEEGIPDSYIPDERIFQESRGIYFCKIDNKHTPTVQQSSATNHTIFEELKSFSLKLKKDADGNKNWKLEYGFFGHKIPNDEAKHFYQVLRTFPDIKISSRVDKPKKIILSEETKQQQKQEDLEKSIQKKKEDSLLKENAKKRKKEYEEMMRMMEEKVKRIKERNGAVFPTNISTSGIAFKIQGGTTTIENNKSYYEFDVTVESYGFTQLPYLDNSLIRIKYEKNAFYSNSIDNGKVTIIQGTDFPHNNYSIGIDDLSSDNRDDVLSIGIGMSNFQNPQRTILSTTPKILFHVKMEIEDTREETNLSFYDTNFTKSFNLFTLTSNAGFVDGQPFQNSDYINPNNPLPLCPKAVITGFNQYSIEGGRGNILKIYGSGFGNGRGKGQVWFKNADDGESILKVLTPDTYFVQDGNNDYELDTEYWTDSEIWVKVPSIIFSKINTSYEAIGTAGSGKLVVENDWSRESSESIDYLDIPLSNTNSFYVTKTKTATVFTVDSYRESGILFRLGSQIAQHPQAPALIQAALQEWSCQLNIELKLSQDINVKNVIEFGQARAMVTRSEFGYCKGCEKNNVFDNQCSSGIFIDRGYRKDETTITIIEDLSSRIPNVDWYYGAPDTDLPANKADFYAAFLHEIGHVLNLAHVNNTNELMYKSTAVGFKSANQRKNLTNTLGADYASDVLTSSQKIQWNQGCSSNSSTPLVTPSCLLNPPTNLSANFNGVTSTILNWSSVIGASGYVIERKVSGDYVQIARIGKILEYVDDDLTSLTTYNYRIKAFNNFTESEWANFPPVTTPIITGLGDIPKPWNVTLTIFPANQTVQITWDYDLQNATFTIQRSTDINFESFENISNGSSTFFQESITPNTKYFYRLKATRGDDYSYWTDVISAIIANVPNAPTQLEASVVASDKILLNWTDNSDNETGFRIERYILGENEYEEIFTTTSNIVLYFNNNLANDKTYFYRIKATNQGVNSDYSNEVSINMLNSTVLKPNAPSSLQTVDTGIGYVILEWIDNSIYENHFEVHRAIIPNDESIPESEWVYEKISEVPSNSNRCEDRTLEYGKRYAYKIRAVVN